MNSARLETSKKMLRLVRFLAQDLRTVYDVADYLEVSKKTAARYITAARELGLKVDRFRTGSVGSVVYWSVAREELTRWFNEEEQ